MIDVSKVDRFLLYPGHVDLRKGMSTLGALVASVEVPAGKRAVFLFCNQSETMIKVFERDDEGTWLYVRGLDGARFGWPRDQSEALAIDKRQLTWLLMGLRAIKAPPKKPVIDY